MDTRTLAAALFERMQAQPLTDWILDRLDEGKSPERVAVELAQISGDVIDPSRNTILNWLRAEGIDPDEHRRDRQAAA